MANSGSGGKLSRKQKREKKLNRLANDGIIIAETANPWATGDVGWMARRFAQVSMPYRDPKTNEFERRNGNITLLMSAPSRIGLPYGRYARLLFPYICEAAMHQGQRIKMGDTLGFCMREMGVTPSGRARKLFCMQAERLFMTNITIFESDERRSRGEQFAIAKKWECWWDTRRPDDGSLFENFVLLNDDFYEDIIKHPFPVDKRVLRALRSPLAIDIYYWLTWRMAILWSRWKDREVYEIVDIRWTTLQVQFGSQYPSTTQGRRNFRKFFIQRLEEVLTLYPAEVVWDDEGITLFPSQPHVRPRGELAARYKVIPH